MKKFLRLNDHTAWQMPRVPRLFWFLIFVVLLANLAAIVFSIYYDEPSSHLTGLLGWGTLFVIHLISFPTKRD